jgi:hypothetical protein
MRRAKAAREAPAQGEATGEATRPRTAGEAAASAAKNTASGFQNAVAGLGELFGAGKKPGTIGMSMGIPAFDEETYQKAKELFKLALSDFADAAADLRDVMRALIVAVTSQYGPDVRNAMQPYVVRYINDMQRGLEYDPRKETGNVGTSPTGATGAGPLEGVSPQTVRGPQGGGNAGKGGSRRGTADAGRNGGTAGGGVPAGGRLGDGEGNLPIPAGGTGGEPGSTGVGGVPGSATTQSDLAQPVGTDYVISDLTRLGEGGQVAKYNDNVAAINLLRQL